MTLIVFAEPTALIARWNMLLSKRIVEHDKRGRVSFLPQYTGLEAFTSLLVSDFVSHVPGALYLSSVQSAFYLSAGARPSSTAPSPRNVVF
jgi:hypothetical protein